jgi:hypothetical protein
LRVFSLLLLYWSFGFLIWSTLFFREMLKFPQSVLPSLTVLGIGLFNKNNRGYLKFLIELHVF